MSETFNKIKNWYQNFSSSKVSFERKGIKPAKDWNIVIFSSLTLLFIFGAIAFYFYVQVENGTFFGAVVSEELTEVKINNKTLDKLINDINVRERNLIEIEASRNAPANPSL